MYLQSIYYLFIFCFCFVTFCSVAVICYEFRCPVDEVSVPKGEIHRIKEAHPLYFSDPHLMSNLISMENEFVSLTNQISLLKATPAGNSFQNTALSYHDFDMFLVLLDFYGASGSGSGSVVPMRLVGEFTYFLPLLPFVILDCVVIQITQFRGLTSCVCGSVS